MLRVAGDLQNPEILSSLASRRLETTDQRIAGASGASLRPGPFDQERTFPSEDDDRKIESLITSISAACIANARSSAYVHKGHIPRPPNAIALG